VSANEQLVSDRMTEWLVPSGASSRRRITKKEEAAARKTNNEQPHI
jgi:hypothetical protein